MLVSPSNRIMPMISSKIRRDKKYKTIIRILFLYFFNTIYTSQFLLLTYNIFIKFPKIAANNPIGNENIKVISGNQ